ERAGVGAQRSDRPRGIRIPRGAPLETSFAATVKAFPVSTLQYEVSQSLHCTFVTEFPEKLLESYGRQRLPRALITGITGQDGSYLAELLLSKGYEVHGILRRASSFNTERIDHLYQDPHEPGPRIILHYGDLTDSSGLSRILQMVQPDEVYNLGSQS